MPPLYSETSQHPRTEPAAQLAEDTMLAGWAGFVTAMLQHVQSNTHEESQSNTA
jgi:hypothetical protein